MSKELSACHQASVTVGGDNSDPLGGTHYYLCNQCGSPCDLYTPPDQPEDAKVQEISHTLLYQSWISMKQRCYNDKSKQYPNYGGRGIRIADEWLHDFTAFRDYIGDRPGPKYSIDRIDNDGNYEPGNVRWATQSTQNFNRRIKDDDHVPGVELRGDGNRWQATIRVNGRYHYLGRYATKKEAVAARHAAELQYFNTTKTRSTVEPGTHNEITDEILSVIGVGAGGSYAALREQIDRLVMNCVIGGAIGITVDRIMQLFHAHEQAKVQAARIQRTLDAFTQLKNARINHTLTIHPDDWMREIDFMDMEMNRQLMDLQSTQPPAADTTKQGEGGSDADKNTK